MDESLEKPILQVYAQKIGENINTEGLAELREKYGHLLVSEFNGQVFVLMGGIVDVVEGYPYLLSVQQESDRESDCRCRILEVISGPDKNGKNAVITS